MIEKMKFISVIGPKDQLDTVTKQYLSRYEIQLENAVGELKNLKNITPSTEANPYREIAARAQEIEALYGSHSASAGEMDVQAAMDLIQDAQEKMQESAKKTDELQKELKKRQELLSAVKPYLELHFDISRILHFREVRFRFGRLPVGYYERLKTYAYDDACTIFEKCGQDEEYVWGVYFVPDAEAKKVDAIYSSLHFERIFIEDAYRGTVDEACRELEKEIADLEGQISLAKKALADRLSGKADGISAAAGVLARESRLFDIRRLAAFTKTRKEVFFILCGWMTSGDADRLKRELEDDPEVFASLEENPDRRVSIPPTRLKNPKLLKPFEMFIRMYGLPNYQEFDPTLFVAVTYSIIFGAMFGDAGQGLVLLIGGLLLYRVKKLSLAAIIASCGFFSTIFGFLYGSVFGFEDWIPALWLRPTEAMTNLPFIGTLNTVFVVTIALGMGLILLTMVFHIANAVRAKRLGEALFDTNGVAGLVFYGAVVTVVALFMTGHTLPAAAALAVLFVVPLLVIACKEPLEAWLEKKKYKEEGGPVMFVVQAFFELFEVCLSYFSNTLSFVRIGAFAVSHAAMMQVVMMLAGAENGGTGNLIVVIVGNLIVMGMEGLIVGIQVLRLQYYEFFSRFYKGDGRAFEPYIAKEN
ncbi:MAG: V-type ATPase 116kDa subunit family protein [Eubacteriales bacterium]|nr:V-type ATPase 116kDa subunit family protein [Eubacteriales bacterium]